MAVLMILEVPGGTLDQYERTNEILGIAGDADAPEGLIEHSAGATDNGVLVVDVWESEEALGRFFETRLGSALHEAGVPDAAPRILPVHNRLRGTGSAAGVIMVAEVPGMTSAAYDRMTGSMSAHEGEGANHESVSHTAATAEDGLVIVDVWDSADSFLAFAQGQVAAAGEAVDMPQFQPRFVPLHNRIVGSSR